MTGRLIWWLVLRFAACRATRQGMIDGQQGMLPQVIDSDYYMAGYHLGRARFLDRSFAEPWTTWHRSR